MQYSKTVRLKDGRECLIRSAEKGDAAAVFDNLRLAHSETDFLLSYPEEGLMDIEKEGEFLADKFEAAREVQLCAFVAGHLAGTAGITAVGSREKLRHRAELGISLEKASWGVGIGRALVAACIDCARSAGYAQLELDVVAQNVRALSLYQSVGFTVYGRNPRGFRSRTAGWQELVLMRLELE